MTHINGALGATAQDWAAWASLGLTADLLPVVADTSTPVSPLSNLKSLGKTPSYLNAEGEALGFGKWTQHSASSRDLNRWAKDNRLGICLQTREVRAIDVDVEDEALAASIAETLELMLGPLPWRTRAGSARRLALVRCPGELRKHRARNGDVLVELLATGQQCVVTSTHPSGARYEWDGARTPGAIPEVSLAELMLAWEAVARQVGGEASADNAPLDVAQRRPADIAPDPILDYLDAKGLILGWAPDGKAFVDCPKKDLHSSDSGPSEACWLPAGVGGVAEGRFHCLHESHGKIGTSLFLELIGYGAGAKPEDFEVVPLPPPVPAPPMALRHLKPWESDAPHPAKKNDSGKIEATATHLQGYLERPDLCDARIAYDEFKSAMMIEWRHARGEWRAFKDTDYFRLRMVLEARGFVRPQAQLIKDAVKAVADDNRFDSAITWLRGLHWDGVPRVERFYLDCFGLPDTPYHRAVGRYTWTALAGRVLVPGCKAHMVPTFIGGQGKGKTDAVMAMAPSQGEFVEVGLDTKEDDLARKMRGKLVGELGEMKGLSTRAKEDAKQWISRPVEEWTPKYEEFPVKVPRRCIIFGTGNVPEFLDDETGNRRWLPMDTVFDIDLARIERDRDQLWAEGAALFRAEGVAWEAAMSLAPEEHKRFTVHDARADVVAAWLARDNMEGTDGPTRGSGLVRVSDVLAGAFGLQPAQMTKSLQMECAKILASLGYEKDRTPSVKGWRKPVASVLDAADFA